MAATKRDKLLKENLEGKISELIPDPLTKLSPPTFPETKCGKRYKDGFLEIIKKRANIGPEQHAFILVSHSDGIEHFVALNPEHGIDTSKK